MKRISLALALSSLPLGFVLGCGHPALTQTTAAPKHETQAIRTRPPETAEPTTAKKDATHPALSRKAGDYIVFQYSGSFRKTPLTLTERVVAKEGTVLVIDFTLTEGKKEETLRVRMDFAPGGRGEIFDIARMDKGVEKPASKDAYDAMMAKTIVVADANEEDLGTEDVNVEVSGKSINAKKTSYRVVVGKSSATMSITAADGFAWGDLGGEIKTKDGALLYRAQLVDMGSAPATGDTVIAKGD